MGLAGMTVESRGSIAGPVLHPDAAEGLFARYGSLLARLAAGEAVDGGLSDLVGRAAQVWSRPGFDVLLSRPMLRFEPFDYQV